MEDPLDGLEMISTQIRWTPWPSAVSSGRCDLHRLAFPALAGEPTRSFGLTMLPP